jgi:CheY-like chemotaxis protein
MGIEVEVANSGAAALDLARAAAAAAAPFSVVLSDMNMPVMNGVELAAALGAGAGTEGTPIVLLSASGDIGDLGPTPPPGIAASLAKPVRRERLFRCLAELDAGPKTESPAPPPSRTTSLHRGRVLLAEDNLVNQKVAVAMLGSGGYTVDIALNGREAVLALRARRYEVVLMDCQMPEMDGYEAAAAIRADEGSGRRTPIIAMTAGAMPEDRDRAKAAGMDDYLAKPVRRDDVLAAGARWAAVAAPTR